MSDVITTDRGPALADQRHEKIKARHDELSKDIRKSALVLLTYCFFCFLTLGQTDVIMVSASGELPIPFANIDINPRTFMWVGPLILILLTAYLHVFICEHCEITALEPSDKLPYVFNLENWVTKGLGAFTFYILPGIILLTFAVKVLPRPDHAYWFVLAGLTLWVLFWTFMENQKLNRFYHWERINELWATTLLLLMGRAMTQSENSGDSWWLLLLKAGLLLWVLNWILIFSGKIKSLHWERISGLISIGLVLIIGANSVDILNGDLQGVVLGAMVLFWLSSLILILFGRIEIPCWERIYGIFTTGIIVLFCVVAFYNIFTIFPTRLNLRDAQLNQHDLIGYHLVKADLRGANLEEANLHGANLHGADLGDVNIIYTDFRSAEDLEVEQVKKARYWDKAFYDDMFRKELGITDKELLQSIFEYLSIKKGNVLGYALREQRLRDFMKFYGLNDEIQKMEASMFLYRNRRRY